MLRIDIINDVMCRSPCGPNPRTSIRPVIMACALLVAGGYDPDAQFTAYTPDGTSSLTGRIGTMAAAFTGSLDARPDPVWLKRRVAA